MPFRDSQGPYGSKFPNELLQWSIVDANRQPNRDINKSWISNLHLLPIDHKAVFFSLLVNASPLFLQVTGINTTIPDFKQGKNCLSVSEDPTYEFWRLKHKSISRYSSQRYWSNLLIEIPKGKLSKEIYKRCGFRELVNLLNLQ